MGGLLLLLLQVVYGVLRYSRFINAFLASFYDKNRWGMEAVNSTAKQYCCTYETTTAAHCQYCLIHARTAPLAGVPAHCRPLCVHLSCCLIVLSVSWCCASIVVAAIMLTCSPTPCMQWQCAAGRQQQVPHHDLPGRLQAAGAELRRVQVCVCVVDLSAGLALCAGIQPCAGQTTTHTLFVPLASYHPGRQLVCAHDARQMEVLLGYLFDPTALQGPCRQDWLKVYDKEVCLCQQLSGRGRAGGWVHCISI